MAHSCSPKRRTARGDRSPIDGVASSSAVANGVECDRCANTRVVVARPSFRIDVCSTFIC